MRGLWLYASQLTGSRVTRTRNTATVSLCAKSGARTVHGAFRRVDSKPWWDSNSDDRNAFLEVFFRELSLFTVFFCYLNTLILQEDNFRVSPKKVRPNYFSNEQKTTSCFFLFDLKFATFWGENGEEGKKGFPSALWRPENRLLDARRL